MRIAITGANSSVGKTLLRHIQEYDDEHDDGHDGLEARAGVRTQQAAESLPSGARITPCVIRYGEKNTLAALLDDATCVVHLAGILIEGKHSDYQTANVDATQAVVEACRDTGVKHIVFTSTLGADVDSGNRYYRSKAVAEEIVGQSGISSTIIRTPMLLGPGTAGARSLVGMASRESVKVLGGGHHSLRPLDVDDLSQAILSCCRAQADGVAVHDLVGPESVTFRELIAATGRMLGHDVAVGTIPVWTAKFGAVMSGLVRRGGMTPTVIDVITADETVTTNADAELGVNLTPLAATLEKLRP